MHQGLVPRGGVRALRDCFLLVSLTLTSAALADEPVEQVATVALTDDEPIGQATSYDGLTDEQGASDLSDRPTIQVDGKSCRSCCPGCCPSGTTGSYGTGSSGTSTSGTSGPGTTTGQGLTLTPQQYGALDPTVSAVSFGGGGYLDIPFIVNQFRLRYDDAYDDNAPDRAEYFYAKCGCFRNPQNPGGPQRAAGPTDSSGTQAASYVNYQAIRTYLELRLARRFSLFAELPVQFDNIHFAPSSPNSTAGTLNTGGFADMNVGFKYNLLNRNGRYLTFQLRTYLPTGDSFQGLGTRHVSLEPSLLYWRTISDRAFFQAQLTDWAPVGGSNFAGDILQYGAGFGYVVYRRYDPTARSTQYAANLPPQLAPQNYFLITPLLEGMGWTVLSGQQYMPPAAGPQSAQGDTIFNLKLGVRFTKGFNSVYTGWAHAITEDVWYRNMFRLEYRRFF